MWNSSNRPSSQSQLILPSGYFCLHPFILQPHFCLSRWYFSLLHSSFHLSTVGRAYFLIGLSNANLMNLAVVLHSACPCTNIHKYATHGYECSTPATKACFRSQVDAKIQIRTHKCVSYVLWAGHCTVFLWSPWIHADSQQMGSYAHTHTHTQ